MKRSQTFKGFTLFSRPKLILKLCIKKKNLTLTKRRVEKKTEAKETLETQMTKF